MNAAIDSVEETTDIIATKGLPATGDLSFSKTYRYSNRASNHPIPIRKRASTLLIHLPSDSVLLLLAHVSHGILILPIS